MDFSYLCPENAKVLLPLCEQETSMRHFHHIIFVLQTLLLLFPATAMLAKESSMQLRVMADKKYYAGQYPEALDYYILAMEQAEREKDYRNCAACTGYIGNIYDAYGDYNSCMVYYEKGYALAKRIGDSNLQSNFLTNLITVNCRLGNVKKAHYYYTLSSKTPNTKENNNWQYYLLYNKARILTAEGRPQQALDVHSKAEDYARYHGMGPIYVLFQMSEIGNLYVRMGRYKEAVGMGRRCEAMADSLNNGELLVNAYKMLADAYSLAHQENKARIYRTRFFSLSDSVYNMRKFFDARHKLNEYEDRVNNERLNKLHDHIYMQNTVIIITIVFLLILAVLILYIYRKNRHLLEAQRLLISKNSELDKQDKQNQRLLQEYLQKGGGCQPDDEEEPATQRERPISEENERILLFKINDVMVRSDFYANPDCSLQDLARATGSNTHYVSWVINDSYHKNFKALLNEYRIREACRLLADKDHSERFTLQAVYEQVGYNNAASFIRAFRKVYGMTPTEYRRIINEEEQGIA